MTDKKKYWVHPWEADAPERIWAWGWRADSVWQEQTWQHEDEPMSTMEYVRADLFAALTELLATTNEQLAAARQDAKGAEAYAEELEADRKKTYEALLKVSRIHGEVEAKLAKAVEGLDDLMMHEPDYPDTIWEKARATLAEIKGESHE